MKRLIGSLVCILFVSAAWAESNLQTRTMTKDQDRTKTELRLQDRTQDKIQEQDFEKLMLQVRNRTRTQAEYQENLEFMLSYALRNQVRSSDELNMASDFYQKNCKAVSGTAREKRNTLMVKAEQQIRTQAKNQGVTQYQLKEKNNLKTATQLQTKAGMQENNMNKNPAQTEVIKQKRAGNGSKR